MNDLFNFWNYPPPPQDSYIFISEIPYKYANTKIVWKKLTNDYESPKLVTCGWNSLSELRPLYSLKSNAPPPPPSCTKFPLKNQTYFINLRDWQIKFTLKRWKKHFIWNLSFFSNVPMLIRKLPLGIKN